MNKHILYDKLTASLVSGLSGRNRFFSKNINSTTFRAHLRNIKIPDVEISVGVHEMTASSLVGQLDPAYFVSQLRGPEYPTIIYHHGNNERPFDFGRFAKNSFKSIFYDTDESIEANLIAVRAPFHNSSLRTYQRKIADLSNFVAMLAASVKLNEKLVQALKAEFPSPILVSGISLGGWVTNLHRAHYNSADRYIPLLAGAALDDLFINSGYRQMAGDLAHEHPEALRNILNFEKDFQSVSDNNVFPLLGKYDQYIQYNRQKHAYGRRPIRVLETGHITSLLAADELRDHLLRHL